MNRLRALTIIVGDVVLTVLGIGMWESPEINWEGFLAAWSTVGNEIARLKDDPLCRIRNPGHCSWTVGNLSRI